MGQKHEWIGVNNLPYEVTVMALMTNSQGQEIPLRGPRGEILKMKKIPTEMGPPRFKVFYNNKEYYCHSFHGYTSLRFVPI